jgi:TetR/AcrR family transcriptional regulator
MTEPKSSQKAATIQKIIQAAHKEFTEKGYDAASLSHIAREAGTTKQLLHYYFSSKDQLYMMAIDDISQSLLCLFDAASYQDLSPQEAIRLLINNIIDFHIALPGLTTLTLDQGLHRGEHLTTQIDVVPQTSVFVKTVLTPILQHGVELGVFRKGIDPALFYASTFHLASGCFLLGSSMSRTSSGMDFTQPEGIECWRTHVLDMVMASLRC